MSDSALPPVPAKKILAIVSGTGGSIYLNDILTHLPADFSAAIVIAHQAPNAITRMIVSKLPERYAKKCPFPISFVPADNWVQASNIYVCPLDHNLSLEAQSGGLVFRLAQSPGGPSFDTFLQSLAQTAGNHCVALALSGDTLDGAAGLQHIKDAGGIPVAIKPDLWTASAALANHLISQRIATKAIETKKLANELSTLVNQIPPIE